LNPDWLQTGQIMVKKQPFEDVFPVKHDDFPASHASFQGFSIKTQI